MLAAGDLNEALDWHGLPGHHGHTWGAEYFARVGEYDQVGSLPDAWPKEQPTPWDPIRQTGLLLDHVIADPVMGSRVSRTTAPERDPEWADPAAALDSHLSDHAPV